MKYFVRKKEGFRSLEQNTLEQLKSSFNVSCKEVEIYYYYEIKSLNKISGITDVICEDVVDEIVNSVDQLNTSFFVTPLPTQFDVRASSCIDCLKLLNVNADVEVLCATLYNLIGFDEEKMNDVKSFFVNPIESCLMSEIENVNIVKNVERLIDITNIEEEFENLSLAMDFNDFKFLVNSYIEEGIKLNEGQVKILDTYWSDHCRHTTFNTIFDNVEILDKNINDVYNDYLSFNPKQKSLMSIATTYPKHMIKNGLYTKKENTIEDNAISIEIEDKYLLQFKNETHNHPTEIEPFGGAATCVGGAIRDPLSGRAYVYQAMRIAGSGNILEKNTLPNKLMQRQISKLSAQGFSSYGNQIGIPTSFNKEIFDESYKAKHLECGCVVGVVEKSQVKRETPKVGDLIVLLGGKTGRDGIGGATGSSKLQTTDSLIKNVSEVQKGNAPQQRNLIRLFSESEFSKTIKKSNDFGAGGISVCALELADGVDIFLDKVFLKEKNMDIIDIALSESQERMAIIIDEHDLSTVKLLAQKNNVLSSVIGVVTSNNHVNMYYNNKLVYEFSRKLLNSGGAPKYQDIKILEKSALNLDVYKNEDEMFGDINLIDNSIQDEYFDSTVLANTVLMPYGGAKQNNKTQTSMSYIKDLNHLRSVVSYGFNPKLMKSNNFEATKCAIVDSISKQVSMGVHFEDIVLSFQEYFKSLKSDELRFGDPLSCLLAAFDMQKEFNIPALGGKDSMSGTYLDIDVVDTFISFALGVKKDSHVCLNYFNDTNETIYIINIEHPFNISHIKNIYNKFLNSYDQISSVYTIGDNPLLSSLIKMSSNGYGFDINTNIEPLKLKYGSLIFSSKNDKLDFEIIGKTTVEKCMFNDEIITNKFDNTVFNQIYKKYDDKLKPEILTNNTINYNLKPQIVDKVNVLVMIFEGTNSYLEMKNSFEKAGANVELFIFNDKFDIELGINNFCKMLCNFEILSFPGGFSKADEPDGSGKYIVNFLKNIKVKSAIEKHLSEDKLIFGVCNGFQALLKSGLITNLDTTLFYNDSRQHISKITYVKYSQSNAPFFKYVEDKDYATVISHGEGKLCVSRKDYETLIENGQVISTYSKFNPNQSDYNIESLISKCGKVYGKMGHVERYRDGLYKNIEGEFDLKIFKSMIKYFMEDKC